MILLSVLPPKPRRKLSIGQRHGGLTIIAKGGIGKWRVRCECGTEKDVYGQNLGRQRSCGCYQDAKNEAARRRLIGQKFNRLTVVACGGRVPGRAELSWDCICECGQNKTGVPGDNLVSGNTSSCGCARRDADARRVLPENIGLPKSERQRRYALSQRGRAISRMSGLRYRRRRWASIKGDLGVTDTQWAFICEQYGRRCAYCREPKPLTQDHVVPISKGGLHDPTNVLPACWDCNYTKRARSLDLALPLLKVVDTTAFVDRWTEVGYAAKEIQDA